MVSAESEFQVRHRPKIDKVIKPRSRIATGDGGRGGRSRRESAAGSLQEFAEMNTDSGIFNAVTMEEISVGARYYRELNVSVCMCVCVWWFGDCYDGDTHSYYYTLLSLQLISLLPLQIPINNLRPERQNPFFGDYDSDDDNGNGGDVGMFKGRRSRTRSNSGPHSYEDTDSNDNDDDDGGGSSSNNNSETLKDLESGNGGDGGSGSSVHNNRRASDSKGRGGHRSGGSGRAGVSNTLNISGLSNLGADKGVVRVVCSCICVACVCVCVLYYTHYYFYYFNYNYHYITTGHERNKRRR